MNLDDIVADPKRHKIFDTILEEACRQWCDFIGEAPERASGDGFARFFFDVFEMKEQEYMKDLNITSQEKPSIRQALKENQDKIAAKTATAPDKEKKQETAL